MGIADDQPSEIAALRQSEREGWRYANELEQEIERLRRGEFICQRCMLRKDSESSGDHGSSMGILTKELLLSAQAVVAAGQRLDWQITTSLINTAIALYAENNLLLARLKTIEQRRKK